MALVVGIGLLVPAALVGVGMIGVRAPAQLAQRQHDDLQARLEVLERSLAELLWGLDARAAREVVDAALRAPDAVRIRVVDLVQDRTFVDIERPERRRGHALVAERDIRRRDRLIGRVSLELDDSGARAALLDQRLLYLATVSAQGLLSLALIVWLLGTRVARPLQRLTRFADDLAEGRFTTTLGLHRGDEIGRLGERLERTRDALRTLFDAQRELLERVSREEAHARQQAQFYAALSGCNQLIVRQHDEPTLYAAVCRICVDTGHARVAAVWLGDDGAAALAASAGPLRDLLGAAGDATAPALVLQALADGRHCVVDDCLADPRAALPVAQAAACGVRALAVFPVRRGQRPCGALALYAPDAGTFDAATVAVLDAMASDLSFALDNLDRERDREAAQRALHDSEQRLSEIIETALDAIIGVDAQGRIVVFNRAATRLFGVAAGQALGGTLERFIPARLQPPHALTPDGFADAGRTGEAQPLVGVRADGTPLPLAASVSRSGAGTQRLTTAVLRDLSAEREAERARQAQLAAEAASHAKTQFLSRMSHELRTPLNAVLGFSQLLLADGHDRLSERQRAQVESIHQAGWHLLALVNDLLDVSRIEAGRLEMNAGNVDLHGTLDEVVQLVRTQAEGWGVQLVLAYRAQPAAQVRGDPVRIRQVLLNVLSNAVKYNRAGGSVHVALAGADAHVAVVVTDTGMGMTHEQLEHLYEPFNRLGRERSGIEGTGIGMALARQLLQLMDGTIEVQSTPGTGTTVRIALPRAHDGGSPSPAALPLDTTPAAAVPAAAPHGTVLYIEDNPVNTLLVEQTLARWPRVRFLQAEHGRQGIELARRWRPDLVLLDMHLPDMDGLAVLQALQADERTRALRIVALSASAMPDDIALARRSGAMDYWTKPLDLQRFVADVTRLLLEPGTV